MQARAAIEEIVRGFRHRWADAHPDSDAEDNPYSLAYADKLKAEFSANENGLETCRKKYPDVFYYFDGFLNTRVSQSVHPAGIVISPITLADHYGTFIKDDSVVLQIDMEEIHEVSLVKYDLLVLKTIQIIRDACRYAGIPYPKSHEIDWDDQNVWEDMRKSPVGIFQFEANDYTYKMLLDFNTRSIQDMALVTAAARPSGETYRKQLIARIPNKNPSPIIDELLKDNNGYLVYQEDTIRFLQEICGLSGSEADDVRRAIGRKDEERLNAALPAILDGYCAHSSQPREKAEQEAQVFLQILKDSASYMFGKNHSFAYCMIGFLCAWLRYYHPYEFVTAYLNCAANEKDIKDGTQLAKVYGITISSPRFGVSTDSYAFDREKHVISKGISSVKYLNKQVPMELHNLYHSRPLPTFMDVLMGIAQETTCDERQLNNLICIGYFSEYGNTAELARINDVFKYFKKGTAKQIKKASLEGSPLAPIVERHAYDRNAKGDVMKSWRITDMTGLLYECEGYIRNLNIPEVDMKVMVANQKELLGYVDVVTGKEEDRRKLVVLAVRKLYSKDRGSVWGIALTVRSLGTGKETQLTVRKAVFDLVPVKELDIIYGAKLHKNRSGYWYLDWYQLLM